MGKNFEGAKIQHTEEIKVPVTNLHEHTNGNAHQQHDYQQVQQQRSHPLMLQRFYVEVQNQGKRQQHDTGKQLQVGFEQGDDAVHWGKIQNETMQALGEEECQAPEQQQNQQRKIEQGVVGQLCVARCNKPNYNQLGKYRLCRKHGHDAAGSYIVFHVQQQIIESGTTVQGMITRVEQGLKETPVGND